MQIARLEAAIKNGYAKDPVDPAELIPNEDNRQRTDELDDSQLAATWKQRCGF